MKNSRLLLPCLFSMLILIGCGSDSDDDSPTAQNTPGQREEEEVFLPSDFSTRLSPHLEISGEECEGGERTNHPERPDETCQSGEFLLTIDDQNVCSADGACTEVFVFPIVGTLQKVQDSEDSFSLFEMTAESPVGPSRKEILNDYWVKASQGNVTEVIRR